MFLKINWNFYYDFILIVIEKRILYHEKYNEFQTIYKFDSNFNFENNENKNNFDIVFNFDNKKFKFSKIIKVVQENYIKNQFKNKKSLIFENNDKVDN